MAKNLGRKYATMTEDERRQFALEEEEGTRELPAELAFDEPRKEEGPHYASAREEIADPDHRDGLSAQLDDKQHERAVREWGTQRKGEDDTAPSEAEPESSDEEV